MKDIMLVKCLIIQYTNSNSSNNLCFSMAANSLGLNQTRLNTSFVFWPFCFLRIITWYWFGIIISISYMDQFMSNSFWLEFMLKWMSNTPNNIFSKILKSTKIQGILTEIRRQIMRFINVYMILDKINTKSKPTVI